MDLRQVQVLVRLFRECKDDAIKQWALRLVPELADWDVQDNTVSYQVTVSYAHGLIDRRWVRCRPDEIEAQKVAILNECRRGNRGAMRGWGKMWVEAERNDQP